MRVEFTILILVFEIMGIYALNKYISKTKGMVISLFASLILFVVGLWLKKFTLLFDYRLLLVPFIQIGLLSISHIIYRKLFKIPFYLNLRGFKYSNELRSNTSGFVEFLSFGISISIPVILLILFFILD
jgi:hypothetical protein